MHELCDEQFEHRLEPLREQDFQYAGGKQIMRSAKSSSPRGLIIMLFLRLGKSGSCAAIGSDNVNHSGSYIIISIDLHCVFIDPQSLCLSFHLHLGLFDIFPSCLFGI